MDPGPFFYIYISTVYFPQALFYFTANKHLFTHTIRLILCFQQTGEIDNLTVSWSKVAWLCCVQVPRCYWRRQPCTRLFSGALPKSASNNLQKWFLSPTGRLNFGFILRENLQLYSSYLPLGVSQLLLSDITDS
jgi:hypothetical protein